jgi:hypothetical protein
MMSEELDDIERVLDHATWELTDKELRLLGQGDYATPREWMRAAAAAAVKKYQERLASKCGPKPCDTCDAIDKTFCERINTTIGHDRACVRITQWLGQQQGYDKGLEDGLKPDVQWRCHRCGALVGGRSKTSGEAKDDYLGHACACIDFGVDAVGGGGGTGGATFALGTNGQPEGEA